MDAAGLMTGFAVAKSHPQFGMDRHAAQPGARIYPMYSALMHRIVDQNWRCRDSGGCQWSNAARFGQKPTTEIRTSPQATEIAREISEYEKAVVWWEEDGGGRSPLRTDLWWRWGAKNREFLTISAGSPPIAARKWRHFNHLQQISLSLRAANFMKLAGNFRRGCREWIGRFALLLMVVVAVSPAHGSCLV